MILNKTKKIIILNILMQRDMLEKKKDPNIIKLFNDWIVIKCKTTEKMFF